MSDTESRESRVKKRTENKARPGRGGGTKHKKLVEQRRREVELRKKRKNMKIEC